MPKVKRAAPPDVSGKGIMPEGEQVPEDQLVPVKPTPLPEPKPRVSGKPKAKLNQHMTLRAQAGQAAPRITLPDLIGFEGYTPGVPGRKSQISKEVIDTICENIAKGMPDSHATAVAGIRSTCFYNWLKQSQTAKPNTLLAYLLFNYELAKVYRERLYLARINESTDWRAAAWMLERTNARVWGKQAVEQEAKKAEPEDALTKLIGTMDKTAAAILKQQEAVEGGPQVYIVKDGADEDGDLADADANQDDQERRRIGFRHDNTDETEEDTEDE